MSDTDLRFSRRSFLVAAGAVAAGAVHTAPSEPTVGPLQRTGWNALARQRFMHAPIFHYIAIPSAAAYRCTISWRDNTGAQMRRIDSPGPDLDFAAIWPDLPSAGDFTVSAEALDAQSRSIAQSRSTFTRVAPFKGPYRPAKCGYLESGAKAALWVLNKARDAKALEFPTLFTSCYNDALLTYARLCPKADQASAALEQARKNGQALIAGSAPADWVYAHAPRSHKDPRVLQIPRCGMAGLAYLDLLAATGDSTFLQAAMHIAETLKKNQLADGRWYFRVDPQTGKMLIDYTSDQVEPMLLLDELIRNHGRKDLIEARDKTAAWLLAKPCKTYLWQQQYEDVPEHPPYQNLEWFDVGYFIPYLLRNATAQNGYEKLAMELFRYIEDQFVDWEPSGNYITPGVREQYVCYHVIDAHVGLYIRACLALHMHTRDAIYLRKAKAMADTLTAVQHPDGYYPTWMNHKPTNEKPTELREIAYRDHWANCTAIAAANVMKLAAHLGK